MTGWKSPEPRAATLGQGVSHCPQTPLSARRCGTSPAGVGSLTGHAGGGTPWPPGVPTPGPPTSGWPWPHVGEAGDHAACPELCPVHPLWTASGAHAAPRESGTPLLHSPSLPPPSIPLTPPAQAARSAGQGRRGSGGERGPVCTTPDPRPRGPSPWAVLGPQGSWVGCAARSPVGLWTPLTGGCQRHE